MMSEDHDIRASESTRRSPWGPEAIVRSAPSVFTIRSDVVRRNVPVSEHTFALRTNRAFLYSESRFSAERSWTRLWTQAW